MRFQIDNNMTLLMIDGTIRNAAPAAKDQVGLAVMATVLAVRRLLAEHGIKDRARRMRVIKAAAAEFEAKLREHVKPDVAD